VVRMYWIFCNQTPVMICCCLVLTCAICVLWLDQGILVDCNSAQRSAGNSYYMVEDANHMEVCKPPSKEHPSYGLLLQFIIACGMVSFNDVVSSIFYWHWSSTYFIKYSWIFLLEGSELAWTFDEIRMCEVIAVNFVRYSPETNADVVIFFL
jgi:hypothetical protein